MDGSPEDQPVRKPAERQRRVLGWVRELAAIPDRFAGSASERAAAERVGEWFREIGFDDIETQPVASRPRSGSVLAIHLGAGFLAVALGGLVGAALAAVAAVSYRRELGGGRALLTRMASPPESLDVVARRGPRRPTRRVVLSAHIDTTQAGWLFSKPLADFFAGAARSRQPEDGPRFGAHALSLALLGSVVLLCLSDALGAGGWLLGTLRLLTGGALFGGMLLGLEWSIAPATPGANDGASAVAAMLTCAEQLLTRLPEEAELWVVGSGAGEVGGRGLRSFCAAHPDWPPARTFFVHFESVGGGALHWVRSEGSLGRTEYPPLLPELARRVAASGAFGDITPADLLTCTDGSVPAGLGLPSLTLVSLEEGGLPRNHHRAEDLPEDVDTECVVRAADFGAAVARAALRGEAGPIALV